MTDGASSSTSAMWVLPRDTVGKATLWNVLKENAFFELLEHRVSGRRATTEEPSSNVVFFEVANVVPVERGAERGQDGVDHQGGHSA